MSLPRQRYDLDYPQSRVRYINHDAATVTLLGYVVWPRVGRSWWADKEASERMIAGMRCMPCDRYGCYVLKGPNGTHRCGQCHELI